MEVINVDNEHTNSSAYPETYKDLIITDIFSEEYHDPGYFISCIFKGVSFSGFDLRRHEFHNCHLVECDFGGANLSSIKISKSYFYNCNFYIAKLICTKLHNDAFVNCSFRDADLSSAVMEASSFQGCTLNVSTILTGADMGTECLGLHPVCPTTGAFIGYKKLCENKIATLFIPEHAKRSSSTSRKCRASSALVLHIENQDGTPCEIGYSYHTPDFVYRVGDTVIPDYFAQNRWDECANGIHFFISKEEAAAY